MKVLQIVKFKKASTVSYAMVLYIKNVFIVKNCNLDRRTSSKINFDKTLIIKYSLKIREKREI